MIVEDNEQDLQLCRDGVSDFRNKNGLDIDPVECRTLSDALSKLDNSYDGAIIDLKLGDESGAGNAVVTKITEMHLRIPVAILTGTPDAADADFTYIGVFKKGEPDARYDRLLERFWGIHNTGLTRIVGGRGKMEDALDCVFRNSLMPEQYRNKWIEYGKKDSAGTEKALLRHTLNHLIRLLDSYEESYFPEEFYLPCNDEIRTGGIIKEKTGVCSFVIMTPACDLAVRSDGRRNTDRILAAEIDPHNSVLNYYHCSELNNDQKSQLKAARANNYKLCYHWLPETELFRGGFLNFRKLITLSLPDELEERFGKPIVQISPPFVKDIVARLSAYYARQGQPEIDASRLA
jgi:hypothetical protein